MVSCQPRNAALALRPQPKLVVMAGLVPAIHVLPALRQEDVDDRHKAGHDELNKVKNHGDP
jgi:hypothetical protein